MYFFLDRKNRFVQFGLSGFNTPEEVVSQFIDPNLLQDNIIRYRKSLIVFQCKNFTKSSTNWALRFKYSRGFAFEIIRTHNSKTIDNQCYLLWNLNTHQVVGRLPLLLNESVSISAHNGCVRIDADQGQLLCAENQRVRIQGAFFVVTPTPLQPISMQIPSTLAACFCAIIIALFSFISKDSFANLVKKSETHFTVQESPAAQLSEASPTVTASPQTPGVPEKYAQVRPQEANPVIQKKNPLPLRPGGLTDTSVDPMRCRPIEKKHKSSLLDRFSQNSSQDSKGQWYVCR